MNVRSVVGAPITATVFLLLSVWPANAVAILLPTGWKLLGIPVAIAIAFGFVHIHETFDGTFWDVWAYLFWVYAVTILLMVVDQVVNAAIDLTAIIEAIPSLLFDMAFVLVVYASAWWLVYRDGYARIRPLNWGTSGDHADR